MEHEVNLTSRVVYGKSTQDSIPTPTSPIPIISLYENYTVNVRVEKNDVIKVCSVDLPHGLRGIPTTDSELANYTDTDGIMWCCDEINTERGVYIQRIGIINPKDCNFDRLSYEVGLIIIHCDDIGVLRETPCLCNKLTYTGNKNNFSDIHYGECGYFSSYLTMGISATNFESHYDCYNYLCDNDYYVFYILKTPIEIPLNFAEIGVDYHERMLSYYPEVIQSITEFQAIIDSEYPEFETLSQASGRVLSDAYLLTMTEDRVEEWENMLGIRPLEGSTVEDRRDTIIARIRGQGKLNTEMINIIVGTFTGGTANSWVKDGTLYVEITPSPNNKQYRFENVEQELAAKVPAHLGFRVSRNYYTWEETKNKFTTWSDVKESFDQWNDVLLFIPFN